MIFATLLAAAEGQQAEAPAWFTAMPMLMIGLMVVLLFVLPNRRQQKERQQMMSRLKKGDRIVNSGGIIGVVDGIKDKEDEVLLKGGLRITKSSIVKIEEEKEGAS
jgi:preprotein translocase subunit YajC